MGYGPGAVMGVPAHDQRDFEFARAFGLPIVEVIREEGDAPSDPATWDAARTAKGSMADSGAFDGTPAEQAIGRVTPRIPANGVGRGAGPYRLRDCPRRRQGYIDTP